MKINDSGPDNEKEGGLGRSRNIARGVGSLTAQNILTSLLGFVFLASLLRLLPQIEYAAYSAALICFTIATTLLTFGLPAAAARFVAIADPLRGRRTARADAKLVVSISILLSSIGLVVFLGISSSLSEFFLKSTEWTWVFWLSGLWLFSGSVSTVLQGVIQGMKRYSLLAKIMFISKLVMVAFTVAALFLFHNVAYAIIGWILNYSILGIWASRLAFSASDGLGSNESTSSGYSAIFRYAWPLGIAGVIAIVAANADSIVVAGYLTPINFGVYNAVVTVSVVMNTVLVFPLVTAFFPEISSVSMSPGEVGYGLKLATRFIVLIVLPASLFTAAVSSQLLSILSGGRGYLAGTNSLELIAMFFVFVGMQLALSHLLQAVAKTGKVLIVSAVSVATDVILAIALVPEFGILGAATSRVLQAVVGTAVALYFSREYLHNFHKLSFYIKGLVISLVPFIAVFLLSSYVSSRAITIVPYTLLGGLFYLVTLRAMRVINQEDREYLTHLLPRSLLWILRFI